MSQTAKATKAVAAAKAKKRANRGLITSLHVMHPGDLKAIKKAAKLRDESISKFLLAAGAKEAARVLGDSCPTCGGTGKSHKKMSHAPRKAA